MEISEEFKNSLNKLVNESGEKRTALAKQIAIDYRAFSDALNFGKIPTPSALVRIADYFNVSLNFLLGKTDDNNFTKGSVKSGFHSRLKSLCEEKNVTYYQLSKACHFTRSYIYKWNSLKQTPSLEFLELIADYFDVSIDYLMGRTDEKQ